MSTPSSPCPRSSAALVRSCGAAGVALVALVAALAGCDSKGVQPSRPVNNSAQTTQSAAPSQSSATAPVSGFGTDAGTLARRIRTCLSVMSAASGSAATQGAATSATCTLLGHQLTIYTWSDAAAQQAGSGAVTRGRQHYASGRGWTAVTSAGTASGLQATIARSVATALGGTVG